MTETVAQRLEKMGLELPVPPAPVAAYVGFVRHGDLVYVSGQLPMAGGKVVDTGLHGPEASGGSVTIEEGQAAARLCAINLLAQVAAACEGDLERIERCIRLGGFVASTPDFTDHPKIVNGASEFMVEALGDKGTHARAAVGVASLPLNACVEVEGLFAVS